MELSKEERAAILKKLRPLSKVTYTGFNYANIKNGQQAFKVRNAKPLYQKKKVVEPDGFERTVTEITKERMVVKFIGDRTPKKWIVNLDELTCESIRVFDELNKI